MKKIIETLSSKLNIYVKNLISKIKIKFLTNTHEINNEELTKYINKIFEQQEKERIVRWLVNSIRESLDLDKVLNTIVEEIGKLLKVDRCLVVLFEKEDQKLYFRSEYKKNEQINSLITSINNQNAICNIPYKWQYILMKNFNPILINDSEKDKLDEEQRIYLKENNIKSLMIIPVVHKEEFLGIIMVHQLEYQRSWKDTHIELLKDTGNQIAVAIGQAILYTEVQKTTRLKSEFLAGMSHELRTPLNAIIGFSEMLLSEDFGEINEKQKKFLNNIAKSGEHLLKLVNDILDLSKIESGNMEINYEIFNISQEINETVSVLNSLALKKNIKIQININTNLFIKADLIKFKQIMYNLINNAIKFSEEKGEIIINVFSEDNKTKVEICDNGIGIAQKDKDIIFNSFRQVDSSLTRKQEGTGLGLTLTKKLVEMQGGKIDFQSEEKKGSKFWFTIPALHENELTKFQMKSNIKD